MNQHAPIAGAEATYQDILDAPEGVTAEIIAGDLYLNPQPASPHGQAGDDLSAELYMAFQKRRGGPGGWWIKSEPEIRFGGDVRNTLVPDIAGWRQTTLPVFAPAPFQTVTPDWTCEILSPSTQLRDRTLKSDVYAEHGVSHYWIIDPVDETLEAFRLTKGKWLRLGAWSGDAVVTMELFEAVELSLKHWWLRDGKPPEPPQG